MQFGGLIGVTFSDFPKKVACGLFTQGCNLNCPYCHNRELIPLQSTKVNIPEALQYVEKRRRLISGVVISGGEPTIQRNLESLLIEIKGMDLAIKLDTNGMKPITLEHILNDGLVDYVAMDVKGPLEKYKVLTGKNIDSKRIERSISVVSSSDVDFEFRTTVVKPYLNSKDLLKIGEIVRGKGPLILQKANCDGVICLGTSKEFLDIAAKEIRKIGTNCWVR